jgi:hypothetical protein
MAIAVAGLLLACLIVSGLVIGLRTRSGPPAGRYGPRRAAHGRLSSGPRHPDWPLPPRRPG